MLYGTTRKGVVIKMDVISGFVIGMCKGVILGNIWAWNRKVFAMLFLGMCVVLVTLVFIIRMAGESLVAQWGWDDLSDIVGIAVGMQFGQFIYNDAFKKRR